MEKTKKSKVVPKRAPKTKEEITTGLLEKQKNDRIELFTKLWNEFNALTAKETGLMVKAHLAYTPEAGIVPKLVIAEIPKEQIKNDTENKEQE